MKILVTGGAGVLGAQASLIWRAPQTLVGKSYLIRKETIYI